MEYFLRPSRSIILLKEDSFRAVVFGNLASFLRKTIYQIMDGTNFANLFENSFVSEQLQYLTMYPKKILESLVKNLFLVLLQCGNLITIIIAFAGFLDLSLLQ